MTFQNKKKKLIKHLSSVSLSIPTTKSKMCRQGIKLKLDKDLKFDIKEFITFYQKLELEVLREKK